MVLSEAYEQVEEMDKGQILYQGRQSGLDFRFQIQRLPKRCYLCTYEADIPIRRHVKVKCEANPYDQTWNAYFLKRKQKGKRTRTSRKGTLSETVYCKGAEEPI